MLSKFLEDMKIIQALDDEPNDVGGLSAEELKAKFDEAGILLQTWINNTFIPALIAENLSFKTTTAIPASTIQAAIENVQSQIASTTLGAIPNNSITYQKLADDIVKILTALRTELDTAKDDIVTLDEKKATKDTATAASDGLLSKEDKVKLDGIASGATRVLVDTGWSESSVNAIATYVVKLALDDLQGQINGKAAAVHTHSQYLTAQDIEGKQDKLTWDDAPTQNSENAVNSGAVWQAIDNVRAVTSYSGTFPVSGWRQDNYGYQVQTISVPGLKANYDAKPLIGVDHLGDNAGTDYARDIGFARISVFETGDGKLTARCSRAKPTTDIPVTIEVFK